MGVVHGTEKDKVLEHKAAIDRHLASAGIPVSYTNVFWAVHSPAHAGQGGLRDQG